LKKVLSDIKIVDLTQHLAGPFCTMLLADMGAEVIKVEPPWGDASRSYGSYPKIEGHSTYFLFPNRNKKSIILNLKSETGIKILKKLVSRSDAIVENFRPGVMDRLRIGYDVLKEINSRIIYASISGFGQDGSYSRRPSYDIISQAMSGWMWLNSREKRGLNSQPSLTLSSAAGSPGDSITGTFCALSILAALHHREITGLGQRIDVAQRDVLMTISGLALSPHLLLNTTAEDKARQINRSIHGVYEAKDGYVVIRASVEKDLKILAETIGVKPEEITPPATILQEWVKDRTKHEISELLAEKIPCAPVLTDKELFEDPNVKERGMIIEKLHPSGFMYKSLATGIKFSETSTNIERLPPELGQDTMDVLKSLGYGDEELAQLIKDKIITKTKDY